MVSHKKYYHQLQSHQSPSTLSFAPPQLLHNRYILEGSEVLQRCLKSLFLAGLHELLPHHARHVLHCPQRFVQHLAGVLREGLQPQVHLRLRRVGNAVSHELDVGVPREHCAQQIAEGVVFIVEDVCGASTVVLLLLDDQSFLGCLLLGHGFGARGFGAHLLLLRHIVLRVRHLFIMISTTFQDEVYLGYPGDQAPANFETSFLGGRPCFLSVPDQRLLECQNCHKEKLTFICQLFCPLQSQHAYNRVLYCFYCQRCERFFRCIKQQTPQGVEIGPVEVTTRVVSESSIEIESSSFEVKQLSRIMKRARMEVEEEVIEEKEEDQFDEEGEEIEEKELDNQTLEKMGFRHNLKEEDGAQGSSLSKEQLQSLKHASQLQQKKEEKDLLFEQYKKAMKQLDGPILMYSNIPIPYNSQPINPKHFCKFCNSKLSMELQLTQNILNINEKLIRLDWGSLMVFTCSNSCLESVDECVVVQYELDAIKESEISALKKRQKNKKRKERKEKSKSRGKEQKQSGLSNRLKAGLEQKKEQDDGDWD